MKKVSFTSKIVSAVMNVIVLIAVCSSWVRVFTNSGVSRRYTLFEISDLFSNLRLMFFNSRGFGSFEIALASLIVSFLAFVMIVLAVISIVCAVIPERTSYRFNTVTVVINSVISLMLIAAITLLNFMFRYSAFYGINISSVFLPTKAPFVVIIFSILSRIILISRTEKPKALPEPAKNDVQFSDKVCSVCGTACDEAAQFCHICGSSFKNEERACPHCGKKVSMSAVFCNYCGERLKENTGNKEIVDGEESVGDFQSENHIYNEENNGVSSNDGVSKDNAADDDGI